MSANRFSIAPLSEQSIQAFRDSGYLIARGMFDAGAVAKIDAWARQVTAAPERTGSYWVFHETSLKGDGRDLICRIERIAPFHAGFRSLSESLGGPVSQLLGEDAVLFKEKINFKMPGGDGFRPHQDSQAGWEDYASFFISALVTIDSSTLENGCLQMVAGHHERGIYRAWQPLTETDMTGMEFVPCPTEPGDVVFFDSYAPHASEPNMSGKARRIYFATYNKASDGDHMDAYYADKHKSFPPDIDRNPDKEYVFRV